MNESTKNKTTQEAHEEANNINAVGLYLSDEMTAEQKESFEEHYFECPVCAKEVEMGQEFLAGIRPIPEPESALRHFWSGWVLAPIAATLLAITTFQNAVTIPRLTAQLDPQPDTIIMAKGLEMGSAPAATRISNKSVTIMFDLPPEESFPYYRVNVMRSEATLFSPVIPAPAPGVPGSVHVTKKTLGTGSFVLAVFGLAKQEEAAGKAVQKYYFKVD